MVKIAQSTQPISGKTIQRNWHVVDMKGKILGRVANEIAHLLMGKQKVSYMPNLDAGDHVIVLNASEVEVTGKKRKDKLYQSYSGYPGGRNSKIFERILSEDPEKIIRHAVSGMLPKNTHRDRRLARLHISANENSPYLSRVQTQSKTSSIKQESDQD